MGLCLCWRESECASVPVRSERMVASVKVGSVRWYVLVRAIVHLPLRLQTSFGVKVNDFQVIRPDRPTKTYTCKLADQVLYPPMVRLSMQQTDRQTHKQTGTQTGGHT